MSDTLARGHCFRTLNIVDDATRECVAIEVDTSLSGHRVVRVLKRAALRRGYPVRIVVDNGPGFTSKALDAWAAYEHKVTLVFIQPGKPIENCIVESFNGRLRHEYLNLHWFTSLADARRKIEHSRLDYIKPCPATQLAGESATRRICGRMRLGFIHRIGKN